MYTLHSTSKAWCLVNLVGMLGLGACTRMDAPKYAPTRETIKAGQALFDERCKTMAGAKIYRTVEGVEGVVLLKIRRRASFKDQADRDWPAAAFAHEAIDDEYIQTFLGYEYSASATGEPLTPQHRGYISVGQPRAGDDPAPGYRYVDVVDEATGERWRYSGKWEEPWQYDKRYLEGYIKFFLVRKPSPKNIPRYGVTYEDHVIPQERALGLASSTVKVIDLNTQEILGEFTRFAWTPAVLYNGPSGSEGSTPWLAAYRCGGDGVGSDAQTRKFVDQVLKPAKN
jgi:hypothetical protein